MSLNQQNFTDAGITMLGNANAGQLLTITRIVIGQGTANTPADIYPLTALIGYKADVAISRKVDLGGGKMLVSGVLTEANMPAGPPFPLRELGIMAKIGTSGADTIGAKIPSDPGGSGISQAPGASAPAGGAVSDAPAPVPLVTGDLLYCASNVFADAPDTVTPGGTSAHAFDITVEIERATNVTVIIGDQSVVDCQNIPTDPSVGPGWYAKREGNIFDFKRAVAGDGIGLDETTFPDRVIISVKTLQVNVDLYVPASHPQCPNPSVGFPDIQAAHDYLLQYVIPTDKFATIHVYKPANLATGFVYTNTINFSHPNSKQISLKGEPRVDLTLTGISSVTPGVSKDVTLGTVSNLIAGIRCWLASTNLPAQPIATPWSGGCKVITAHGSALTMSIEKRDGRANYVTPYNGPGRVSYLPTVLKLNNPTAGIFINCPNGIGTIENICADSGQTGPGQNGPYVFAIGGDGGTIKNCHAWGSRRGFTGGSGTLFLSGECVATQCDFGVTGAGVVAAYESGVLAGVFYFNACTDGIAPSASGFAIGTQIGGMDNTYVFITHCQNAILASTGGSFRGGNIYFQCNDMGFWAQAHSVISINPATYKSYPALNGTDLYAQGMSYIVYARNGGALPPVISPPAGDPGGNQAAYIYVTA